MSTIRLGLVLPLFSGDPRRVVRAAREAEALGYDGVFCFDHFFPPGSGGTRPALELFTTLAVVAEATETVRIGTLVARVGVRPVGLLAKMAATIDVASDGRLVLGLGSGDPLDAPEHEAFGLPPIPGKDDRRTRLRETADAMSALFRGKPYEGGAMVPPIPGPLLPEPAGAEGPPVWLGGQAEEVVRIAARVADGWNGWGLDPASFGRRVALLEGEAAEVGRSVEATWAGIILVGEDRSELESLLRRRAASGLNEPAWTGTGPQLRELSADLASAGATWLIAVPAGPEDRAAAIAANAR